MGNTAPKMSPDLPPAVSGERVEFDSPAGRLSVYVAGEGPPLLLIHSINASGSAAEMRPLHEHYRKTRTVFTVDLPGFGCSERSDRDYTPRLMTDAVLAFTDRIQAQFGSAPIDALALSLSSEFLARAAAECPARFRRLALVSPTGFMGRRQWRAAPGTTRGIAWLYKVFRGPGSGWGGGVFRGFTRPGGSGDFFRGEWG